MAVRDNCNAKLTVWVTPAVAQAIEDDAARRLSTSAEWVRDAIVDKLERKSLMPLTNGAARPNHEVTHG
jgi:hypothetical protein